MPIEVAGRPPPPSPQSSVSNRLSAGPATCAPTNHLLSGTYHTHDTCLRRLSQHRLLDCRTTDIAVDHSELLVNLFSSPRDPFVVDISDAVSCTGGHAESGYPTVTNTSQPYTILYYKILLYINEFVGTRFLEYWQYLHTCLPARQRRPCTSFPGSATDRVHLPPRTTWFPDTRLAKMTKSFPSSAAYLKVSFFFRFHFTTRSTFGWLYGCLLYFNDVCFTTGISMIDDNIVLCAWTGWFRTTVT